VHYLFFRSFVTLVVPCHLVLALVHRSFIISNCQKSLMLVISPYHCTFCCSISFSLFYYSPAQVMQFSLYQTWIFTRCDFVFQSSVTLDITSRHLHFATRPLLNIFNMIFFSKNHVNNFPCGIPVKCFRKILIPEELVISSEKADQHELPL